MHVDEQSREGIMVEDNSIPAELMRMLGQETESPGTEVVDSSAIRRYAAALNDLNPLYLDDEHAKKTGYGGIIAPPTFIFDVTNDVFAPVGEDGRDLRRIQRPPGYRGLRGGNEYEFIQPVRPGDIISRKRKIIDVYQKPGRKSGPITFVISETSYFNQRGDLLAKNRETAMYVKS
ncbi:MAG: MaoC family dehydratase N-terminal domain-containing protein [Chloroflexota bacterium]